MPGRDRWRARPRLHDRGAFGHERASRRPAVSGGGGAADPRVLRSDVGIVGAGPGGLAAANALSHAGLSVTVLDEGARPGGQIFRQLPPGADGHGVLAEPPSHRHAERLFEDFAHGAIDLQRQATVWQARPGRLWFEQGGASRRLDCEHVVLAPGA
ncbi:MAG: NAD(P)-binding protein, partial [Planctomycetes bacterium]|nr:NAD(P)-binding protein [Planctomycetota bacterium]